MKTNDYKEETSARPLSCEGPDVKSSRVYVDLTYAAAESRINKILRENILVDHPGIPKRKKRKGQHGHGLRSLVKGFTIQLVRKHRTDKNSYDALLERALFTVALMPHKREYMRILHDLFRLETVQPKEQPLYRVDLGKVEGQSNSLNLVRKTAGLGTVRYLSKQQGNTASYVKFELPVVIKGRRAIEPILATIKMVLSPLLVIAVIIICEEIEKHASVMQNYLKHLGEIDVDLLQMESTMNVAAKEITVISSESLTYHGYVAIILLGLLIFILGPTPKGGTKVAQILPLVDDELALDEIFPDRAATTPLQIPSIVITDENLVEVVTPVATRLLLEGYLS